MTLPVLIAVSGLIPALAWAESAAKAAATASSAVPAQGAYLAQVLIGLLVVLGLIVAMGWLLRRVGQGGLGGAHQSMKILASLSLGTREKVALIQVGDQQLLLGITPNSINTLHTFAEPVISPRETPAPGDFAAKLKAMMPNRSDKN